jgi:hypothetical protein
MSGYLLLRANPYMATSDANGHFLIKNLPAAEHTFRFWHERVGWLRNVRIGTHTTDPKGLLTLTIRDGDNDLAVSRLPPKLFKEVDD